MIFKKVKKIMIDQDLNCIKLGELTGYSKQHISNIINGHFDSLKAKEKIALALDIQFNELWESKNNQNCKE